MNNRRRDSAAFTLVEMLVVLGLVILVASMSVPSIARIIKANADAQAHNLMSGLIKSARTTAIRDGVYAAIHHQLASPDSPSNKKIADNSFAAVLTTLAMYSLPSVFVDNREVAAPGGWITDDTYGGKYGGDYLHDNDSGKGISTVIFQPDLSYSGKYDIYLRWPADASNASNVPVTVVYSGGSATLSVDQQVNGGKWYLLGRHECAPGMGRVEIRTEGTTGFVIADAVRFTPIVEITRFSLAGGQSPKRIPGTMTFGEVRPAEGTDAIGTYTDSGYNAEGVGASGEDVGAGSDNETHVRDFTTFTLVFTPLGGLTRRPNKQDITFADDAYTPGQSALFGGLDPLWDLGVANADTDGNGDAGEPGARVITMFDYATFRKLTGDDRKEFLDQSAQLMPVNVLLGMLLERK